MGIDADPMPGDVIEFNSLTLAGMLSEWGAEPHRLSPVPDDPDALQDSPLMDALARFDVVLVNAGIVGGR